MNNDSPDSNGWDTAADVFDTLGDLSNATSEVVDNFDVGIKDKNTRENTASGANLGISAMGLASSVAGIVSNSKKYNAYKNKDKKEAAKRRIWANSVDLVGNAISGASGLSNFGYFAGAEKATVEGSKAQRDSRIMDMTSGVLGMTSSVFKIAGNITNYVSGKYEKKAHSTIANSASKFANPNDVAELRQANTDIDALSGGASANRRLSAAEKTQLKAARDKRRNIKARRFAMQQAADLHKIKSKHYKTNEVGYLLEGASNIGDILKNVGKFTFADKAVSNWFGVGGGLVSTLVKAGKTWHSTYQKSAKAKEGEKAFADAKKNIVKKYIDDEVDDVKAEAAGWNTNAVEDANLANNNAADVENNDKNLSDKEAKRLVLMKLGFHVKKNSEVDSISNDELFKRITEKRANQIMHTDKNTKDQMLLAMGFQQDKLSSVSFDDIYKVLSGETV